MKASKYNICIPYKDSYVIFNGVTKRFFLVSSHNKDSFLQIISSPDDYQENYTPFVRRMAEEGFIVNDDSDELDTVRKQYEQMKNSSFYHLMILPTYQCNVRCWYCTQHHRNVMLSENDVAKIKKHIEWYLSHHDLEGFNLSWFGGEPMLNFECVQDITFFAKEICKKHGLSFHASITTNGTLLSRDYLEKMRDLDFTFFQITIDGTKEYHDGVKKLKDKSAYITTLNNVCLINEILPNAEICLRYNYTNENLKPNAIIEDLNQHIPEDLRNKIQLSIMKVWQQDEQGVDNQLIEDLVKKSRESGYRVTVGAGFSICYVDKFQFNCVFPNGKIDKCDNEEMDSSKGMISQDGSIKWEETPAVLHYDIFSDSESACRTCRYLPVCYGPCPKERNDMFAQGQHISCRFADPDLHWRQEIVHYIDNVIFLNSEKYGKENQKKII